MLVLLAVVLANLIGFVTLAVALQQLNRHGGDWRPWLRSLPCWGVLCVGLAGALLVTGGLYKLLRTVQAPAEQAEGLLRLHMLLQEPLEQLRVRVQGADPLQDRRSAHALRLRIKFRYGGELRSEVAHARLRPVDTEGDDAVYTLPWPAVIEGCTSSEGRALAGRLRQLGDFRGVERLAVEIVQRGPRAGPVPEGLVLSPNDHPVPALFRSDTSKTAAAPQKARGQGLRAADACGAVLCGGPIGAALLSVRQLADEVPLWVAVCEDDLSPAHRIAMLWQWELTPAQNELGLLFTLALAGGVLLIAVGVGLLTKARPASPAAPR